MGSFFGGSIFWILYWVWESNPYITMLGIQLASLQLRVLYLRRLAFYLGYIWIMEKNMETAIMAL